MKESREKYEKRVKLRIGGKDVFKSSRNSAAEWK